jgi:hypothetical protein
MGKAYAPPPPPFGGNDWGRWGPPRKPTRPRPSVPQVPAPSPRRQKIIDDLLEDANGQTISTDPA